MNLLLHAALLLLPAQRAPAATLLEFRVVDGAAAMDGAASGFLHALTPTVPTASLLAPIKMQSYRGSPLLAIRDYPRLRALGVRHIQLILSDADGTRPALANETWPGDCDGAPAPRCAAHPDPREPDPCYTASCPRNASCEPHDYR